MVLLGPPPHTAAAPLELLERLLVDARLGIHDVGSGMEARTSNGRLRIEALVEDSGDDAEQRGP